jgi:predicted small metal-binding protein
MGPPSRVRVNRDRESFMRVIECECGDVVQAANDDDLLKEIRRHMEAHHPDTETSEEDLRGLVERKAYDAGDS